jgi:Rrf2 family transcriptional regulator, nitric oxide-sensitive transcriptional repressor
MLSQTSEYALRVIVHLGSLRNTPATIRQLAQVTRVPEGYLAKVLLLLSRAGLVRSQRGPHGGSVLARAPEEISILDVVQSVDPIKRIRSCPLGIESHGATLCPLHRRIDQAIAQVEAAFAQSRVADLLSEATRSKPLCDDSDKTRPVQLTSSASRKRG